MMPIIGIIAQMPSAIITKQFGGFAHTEDKCQENVSKILQKTIL
jgi:hypothetical protein